MSVSPKNKTLAEHIIVVPSDSDPYFEDENSCDVGLEIHALKKRMLAEKSPGAGMLVKRMEAFDDAMSDLYEAIDKFTPYDHHKSYASDLITRRYTRLKASYMMSFLEYVKIEIQRRLRNFHLTAENTQLPPMSEAMAAARTWRRAYLLERAKEAQNERPKQKHAAPRRKAKGPGVSGRPKAALKARTGTRS